MLIPKYFSNATDVSVFICIFAIVNQLDMSYNKYLNKINGDLNIYAQNSA